MFKEKSIVFDCCGSRLLGIIHGEGGAETGVLVVVGGPQYRVGSRRQFLLLARHLAANDVPVMRFDYRGMGDSEGDIRSFSDIGDDIRAAVDVFFEYFPGLSSVVLWGLCDGATAAVFYAHTDPRVKGLILLNPWVHTEGGEAKAYLKHYYLQRLLNKAFWRKVLIGRFEMRKSLLSLSGVVAKFQGGEGGEVKGKPSVIASLPDRMYKGFQKFQGHVGIIISGNDLTAAEFEDMAKGSGAWRKLIKAKSIKYYYVPEADHTFSKQHWLDEVIQCSLKWVL